MTVVPSGLSLLQKTKKRQPHCWNCRLLMVRGWRWAEGGLPDLQPMLSSLPPLIADQAE